MKAARTCLNDRKSYFVYEFESGDIANIIADRENKCKGFIHGGKLDYIGFVLNNGELDCSDILRKRGMPNVRDAGAANPNGQLVYMRFAAKKDSGLLSAITGPGATGGVFYFMPVKNIAGLRTITMSAGDYKYASLQGKELSGNEVIEIMKKISSEVNKSYTNNSEIGFLDKVELSRITEIYVCFDKYKLTGFSGYAYQPLVDSSITVKADSGQEDIHRRNGIKWSVFKEKLIERLEDLGFEQQESVRSNGNVYLKFVKRASEAAHISEPSLVEGSSQASNPSLVERSSQASNPSLVEGSSLVSEPSPVGGALRFQKIPLWREAQKHQERMTKK